MFLFFVLYLDLMPSAKKYGIQVQGYFWALLHGSPIKGVTPARAVAAAAKGFGFYAPPHPLPIGLFGCVSIQNPIQTVQIHQAILLVLSQYQVHS